MFNALRTRPRSWLVAAFAATTLFSAPALADIRLCNYSGETVWAARAEYTPGRTWRTVGWWGIANNQCVTNYSGAPANTRYYFHAYGEGTGRQFGGPNSFCVVPGQRFQLEDAADTSRCPGSARAFFCRWTADSSTEEVVFTASAQGLHESRCDI